MRLPRLADVDTHGAYHPSTYLRRWESWADAKRAAGLCAETRTTRHLSRSDQCTALRVLAFEVGHPPMQREMNELGRYSQRPYYRVWDAWDETLPAAGPAAERDGGVPADALLDELCRLAAALGGSPTIADLEKRGAYSLSPYLRQFSTWNAALRAAGLSVNKPHGVREEEPAYGLNWAPSTARRPGGWVASAGSCSNSPTRSESVRGRPG